MQALPIPVVVLCSLFPVVCLAYKRFKNNSKK